ncbi:GxxExxY protein [Candidatus Margulisiibacteriota bacterium]
MSVNKTTEKIIGVSMEVHNTLGPGFQEVIYQRALAREFKAIGLDYAREENIPVFYKKRRIGTRRVDFVVEEVLVEIKAKAELEDRDFIQTLCYLKAADFRVGLLINFGGKRLGWKRMVNKYIAD